MLLEISDQDISETENVLFGRADVFDDERKSFIKNLERIDLQAVPGSGKTTALLAKLLILSKQLPFSDDSGILVLSHTNVAVNEIEKKIGPRCPQLFTYPNFVGTIQSFVDKFLAIPFFESRFGFKPDFIDAEKYQHIIGTMFDSFYSPSGFNNEDRNRARYFVRRKDILNKYRFTFNDQGKMILTAELNGEELILAKPRSNKQKNYTDYSDTEKIQLKEWLIHFKLDFWKKTRVIHYDDAYFIANYYLVKYPLVKIILRNRFRYIFVDEMQDMDIHQVDILDRVFFSGEKPSKNFQRIGDKNQAIFSYEVKLAEVWKDRETVLNLSKSKRLSANIAKKVQPFALESTVIDGDNTESNQKHILPRIITYNDDTIACVIPHFAKLIKRLQDSNDLPRGPKAKFKAIGWRKYSDNPRKTIVGSYFPNFNPQKKIEKVQCSNLNEFLMSIEARDYSSKRFCSIICNAILKLLELECIAVDGISFSRSRLEKHLRTKHEEVFRQYQ